MLTVHHLGVSQSERIVWLCEELGIEYDLKVYKRAPLLAPAALKNLPGNDMGTAPFIADGDVVMSESGAIVEWIIHRYGQGRLSRSPSDPDYAQYLIWLHSANATLQSIAGRIMTLSMLKLPDGDQVEQRMRDRLNTILNCINKRLGESTYLAGEELSAADIMHVFSLSNMRYFCPYSLKDYPHILRYLQTIGERKAYQRAMAKGDPGLKLLLGADPPPKTFIQLASG